jgi:molecular chaperone GrpE
MSATENQGQDPVIRDRRRIDPVTGQVREPGPRGGAPGSSSSGQPAGGPGAPGSHPRPGRHSVSTPGGKDGAEPGPEGPGPAEAGAAGAGGASQAAAKPGAPAPTSVPDQPAGGDTPPGRGTGTGTADPQATRAAVMLAERTADLQRLQAEYANYRKRVERDRQVVREQAMASVLSELLPVLDDIGRAREHGELSGGFKSVADSLESITSKLGLTTYGENGDPFDPTLHEALMHEYSSDVFEPTCVRILQPGYKVGDRIIRPARVAVAEPGDDAPPAAGSGDDDTTAGPDGAGDQ